MTSSPTPAVLPDARALIADVFRSWDMKRQADAYEAGSYDETLPMQALVARLSPPASDVAVPAGEIVALDDFAYDELWQAIADATRIDGGIIAISVVKFRESIRRLAAADHKVASDTGAGLRGALVKAREALAIYADPTGYTDNNGEQLTPDEAVHPGLLAASTLSEIDAALAIPTDATDGATGGGEVERKLPEPVHAMESLHRRVGFDVPTVITNRHLAAFQNGQPVDGATDEPKLLSSATTPGGDLLEQADTYRQALEEIAAAPDAYSVSIFREPDWQKAHDLLAAGGMTLDAISASNMRFVAERLAAVAEAALKPAGDGGEA